MMTVIRALALIQMDAGVILAVAVIHFDDHVLITVKQGNVHEVRVCPRIQEHCDHLLVAIPIGVPQGGPPTPVNVVWAHPLGD